jgi:uncharacterized protein YabN with tetrapyrrole methylase and pyrophosphatase domain
MEQQIKSQGKTLAGSTLEEMDTFWNEAKKLESNQQ